MINKAYDVLFVLFWIGVFVGAPILERVVF